jgi:hypothetical protein
LRSRRSVMNVPAKSLVKRYSLLQVTSRCARAIEPRGTLAPIEGRARLAELLDDPEGLDAEAIRSALERLTR